MGFTTTLQQQEVNKNNGLRGLNYSHSIVTRLQSLTTYGFASRKSDFTTSLQHFMFSFALLNLYNSLLNQHFSILAVASFTTNL